MFRLSGRMPFFISFAESDIERGALPWRALGPNLASVPADDSLNGGETYASAFELLGPMQALESAEQFIDVRHVEPGTVVADEIGLSAAVLCLAEFDDGVRRFAGELPGVPNQVLECRADEASIATDS